MAEYEALIFVRSAEIDNDKYWVRVYKNISGGIWNWYITVKQDESGQTMIKRHSKFANIDKAPEKILLEYHYNIWGTHNSIEA